MKKKRVTYPMFLSKEERLHQYYVFPTKVLCQIENCEKFEIFFCFCCCLEDLKQINDAISNLLILKNFKNLSDYSKN